MPKSSKKVVSIADQPYKWTKLGKISKTRPPSFFSKTVNMFLQNLKPRKKGSPSKVSSLYPPPPASGDSSSKSIDQGKREVEEIVEKQVVICKKQKTFDDTCDGEKNKFDTKTLNKLVPKPFSENQFAKKPVSSSSDEYDSDSSSNDEEEAKNESVAGAPTPATNNVVTSDDDSNSVEETDSDDKSESGCSSDEEEDAKNESVAGGRATAKNSVERFDGDSNSFEEGDSDDESDSEDSSDEDANNGSVATAPGKRTVESSDDVSNSVKESDSFEEPQTPATSGSRYVYMGNLSRCMNEERVLGFFEDTGKVVSVRLHKCDQRLFCFAHVRFDTSETAQKALKRNGELLYDYPVEIFLVHDEMSSLDLDPRSKFYEYLFMDNLSPSTRMKDVLDFFRDTAKVVFIRFDKSWSRFSGSGYVQFSTPEEARKGLKRNKEKLLGHAVELVLTTHAITSIGFAPYWRKRGPIGRGYGPTTFKGGLGRGNANS